ncbi:hypothetical protein [Sphingobacterium pedocola]|uniref:hypothetical protein n=1 Tax=Sphingobacterium pedocola TaxID=2082722 RepID=UPI0018CBB437|nr:hypothetical protein [Sphingobacterium pedocola]
MKKETYSTMNEFEIETLRDYLGLIQQYTADFQDSIELIYFLFRGTTNRISLIAHNSAFATER